MSNKKFIPHADAGREQHAVDLSEYGISNQITVENWNQRQMG